MNTFFKRVNYLKLDWLGYKGAMDEVIKTKNPDEIVIHLQKVIKEKKSDVKRLTKNKKEKDDDYLWTSTTPDNFLKLIQNNTGFYEVIYQYPHKLYFDIDKKGPIEQGYLNKIMDKINDLFPNNDAAISGSIVEDKTSYHIILNNYLITNEKDRDQQQQPYNFQSKKRLTL